MLSVTVHLDNQRPARSAACVLLLVASTLACGGGGEPRAAAHVPSAANAPEPWIELSPGARFAITQTFDVTRAGAEPFHRDVSLDIDLGDQTPDGLHARAVFVRHGDPVPLVALELTVARDGTVTDWRMLCGGAGEDDLTVTIPHLLALVRRGTPTMMRTDLVPEPIAAVRDPHQRGLQAFRGRARLTDTHFRNLHLSGIADVEATIARGADGMPAAEIEIAFDGLVTPYEEPAQLSMVTIEERIEVRARAARLDLLRACERAPLSTADVSAGMRTVSGPIHECYERERVAQPELRGELTVFLTVQPDGSFSDVHIGESTFTSPTLDACIVDIVSRVRIPHGSAEGPAAFTFPYVFEP